MLIGILIVIGLQAVAMMTFFLLVVASGREFKIDDTGDDPFDKVEVVLHWSGERARQAAGNLPLSDPPRIFADIVSIKFGFATTLLLDVSLVAVVAILVKAEDTRALLKTFSMQRYRIRDLRVPALAVVAMYAVTIGYQVVVSALGIDFLVPQSTVPEQVTRDGLALAMAGVVGCIAAPLAEELFFRGLIVTGLLKWGFLPAAAVSAGLFTLAHLDIGSIIPFFAVGMVMAWLYYWRGCLWDSIAFHFFFNTTSFLVLVSQR